MSVVSLVDTEQYGLWLGVKGIMLSPLELLNFYPLKLIISVSTLNFQLGNFYWGIFTFLVGHDPSWYTTLKSQLLLSKMPRQISIEKKQKNETIMKIKTIKRLWFREEILSSVLRNLISSFSFVFEGLLDFLVSLVHLFCLSELRFLPRVLFPRLD